VTAANLSCGCFAKPVFQNLAGLIMCPHGKLPLELYDFSIHKLSLLPNLSIGSILQVCRLYIQPLQNKVI